MRRKLSTDARTLLCGVLLLLVGSHGVLHAQAQRVDPELARAIRLLISPDPQDEAKGEAFFERLGADALPQLRLWIQTVRNDATRVEALVRELEGQNARSRSLHEFPADEFLHTKLLEARRLNRDGKHEEARRVASAIIHLDPDSPNGWVLRRLIRESKARLAARDVLEPGFHVDRVAYVIGEEPEVVFRLQNHQRNSVTIELDKGVVGEVDMTITRRAEGGTMNRERTRLRIQVEPDVSTIFIGPGKVWEHEVTVKLDKDLPLQGLVVRVQIAGRFRPTRWWGGRNKELENLSLSVPLTEFWVVPPSQQIGCERPLRKLTAALLFGDEVEPFFVGGWVAVWAAEADPYLNGKLVETLLGQLRDLDPVRLRLAGQFLNAATGEDLGANVELWEKWWDRTNPRRVREDAAKAQETARALSSE